MNGPNIPLYHSWQCKNVKNVANGGRRRVNTPSNGGRSGGLNTLRTGGRSGGLNTPMSGGRSGGLNTQSQPAAIPPSEPPS